MPGSPLYVGIWGAVTDRFSARVTRLSAATPEHLHQKKLPKAATSGLELMQITRYWISSLMLY